jgi:chemotaxis protein MotB
VIALCLLFSSAGCVSMKAHDSLVSERDSLAETNMQLVGKVVSLERATESLESERVLLIDEVETAAEEAQSVEAQRAELEARVAVLSKSVAELNLDLDERTAQRDAANEEVRKIQSTYQGLVDDLETELSRGSIEIEQLRSGLRLAVSDEILFASGSAELGADGNEVLATIAEHLAGIDYAIEVVGHSDDRQIRGSLVKRFPSNWELAGARAAAVVRLFLAQGIEGSRLQASSRAEYEPLAPNDDVEGRARNRRIEIRLRPLVGTTIEGGDEARLPSRSAENNLNS